MKPFTLLQLQESAQFVNFLEFERNQWISISKDVDFKKQD